jgi:hypothetical protein
MKCIKRIRIYKDLRNTPANIIWIINKWYLRMIIILKINQLNNNSIKMKKMLCSILDITNKQQMKD